MVVVDRGSGSPIVLVPGLQGRHQWMVPTIEALARHGRAISYSLCGEPGTGCRLGAGATFDVHVDQLDRVLDEARVERAAVCGVSFGGWVGVRYAARRPGRVSALVVASTPGPGFRPDARQLRHIRAPWLLFPAFVVATRNRLRPEMLASLPDPRERWRFLRGQLAWMARAPVTPSLLARRIRLALAEDFAKDCAAVTAPTLVLTGEKGLDRVVPVESTREYLRLIPGSIGAELPRTGHIGCVTRAGEWAARVWEFVDGVTAPAAVAAARG